jgi:putative tryptophan/tyrosine transport system substrate-binding protein
MRRREFIVGLGGAAAWPLAARGQQQAMPVIGFLSSQSADDDYEIITVPFLRGLKETGYVEGQNVAVEYRWAENQIWDRLPALAADLVRRGVAVIVVSGAAAALAAKAATTTIPIVFTNGGDPDATALVASLNRPGANGTGSANLGEMAIVFVGASALLLHKLLPNASRFGVLTDPASSNAQSTITTLQAAAFVFVNARTDSDLETAFAGFSQQRIGGVVVGGSTFYNRRMEQLAALAARHALPATFRFREFARAGGLMSYGSSLGYGNRQAGIYTGRILKVRSQPICRWSSPQESS